MNSKFILLLLLVLPSVILLTTNGVNGQSVDDEDHIEDTIEGEEVEEDEGDATVESDDTVDTQGTDTATVADSDLKDDEEEDEEKPLKASPDADTHILFTQPATGMDMPAGETVSFLVGFINNGDKEFMVETLDASFRYPQDYSFFIQNFTSVVYDRVVEPSRQATFDYAFTPSETFNARPFGLTINLNYKDSEGNIFQDAVFNETVNIVDADDGLDGETFFLYVFLAAVGVLLLVAAQQLLTSFGKKRLLKPRHKPIEMGTQGKGDVDYDWLPQETLNGLNKSPRRSPKQSPSRRRSKRTSGAISD